MKKLFLLALLPMLFIVGCNKEDVEDEKKKQTQCPEGYKGKDCKEQITPSKITLTKIQVTKFPQTNGGASWDVASGPDIFIKFWKIRRYINLGKSYIFSRCYFGNNIYIYTFASS